MKYKTTLLFKKTSLTLFITGLLIFCPKSNAQIGAPTPVAFSQICASSSFNSYTVNFTFTPASFTGANIFTLEMSDPTGLFTTPTPITILSSSTVASPGSFTFAVPTTTAGQNYRFRVKSSSPATTGPSSSAFAAYYRVFNEAFYINNQLPTAVFCSGGNLVLTVDPSTVPFPSPLPFTTLKYKWFKNDVVIAGQTTSSLSVNSAGTYYVAIDYGSCSTIGSVTRSQNVVVTQATSGLSFPITASLPNPICQGTPTVMSTTSGFAYQWFKDGIAIAGANSFQYSTDLSGVYYVNVNAGSCSAQSASYTVVAIDFTATINVPAVSNILPGETKTVEVTTNATSPTYQWYLNGILIPTETTNTYAATTEGDYKVTVTQNASCVVNKDLLFKLKKGTPATKIPTVISPNADGINDTWEIPQEYLGSSNTKIQIISSQGEMVFTTSDYQNDWPQTPIDFKSVNPVYYYIISKPGQGEKKGSITVVR